MKRRTLAPCTALILILTATATHAFTPFHFWSQRFGSTGIDVGQAVAVDASGNVYVTGVCSGIVNFGGNNLPNLGGNDIFLAKYNASGVHQWSQRFGSTSNDLATAVAVDGSGNVVIIGSFMGTANFGGGDLTTVGLEDIILAKYDTFGIHQWSHRFGNTASDIGYSVAIDGSGNVVMTGIFAGTVNFGGSNLVTVAGTGDVFLAKYNANGVHQWSNRYGGTGGDTGLSLAVDGSGDVIVTGTFANTVNFGGGNLVSAGDADIFLARYDPNGVHEWSNRYGDVNYEEAKLALDGTGNVFMTGRFFGVTNLGGGGLIAPGGSVDLFLAKYNSGGTHQWSQRFGASLDDEGRSVSVDGSGNVCVTGLFRNTVDFGGGGLATAGLDDIFLAKYDTNGDHIWSRRFGSASSDQGQCVKADGVGNLTVSGNFQGTVNFGGVPLVGAGSYDIFLMKYSGTGAEPTITSIADIGNDQGRLVSILFSRSGWDDNAAQSPVTAYEAYRRNDAPPALAAIRRDPASASKPELLADGWTQVGSVSAHFESAYGITVPTVGDSTEVLGQYYSTFYIRAATGEPSVFYDSPIDSGYSVDNLAPGVPQNLIYDAGELTWNESSAADFDYFTVYGSNTDDFETATVVGYSVAPAMDVTDSPYEHYCVTATDFSGNEGKPAKLNTLSGVGGTPASYVLSVSNYPNPFNPRTTVSYTVPLRGVVTVAIYDARGSRVATLVNNQAHDAGAYRLDWNGRTSDGASVASGIYFARIEHAGSMRTRKMVLLR